MPATSCDGRSDPTTSCGPAPRHRTRSRTIPHFGGAGQPPPGRGRWSGRVRLAGSDQVRSGPEVPHVISMRVTAAPLVALLLPMLMTQADPYSAARARMVDTQIAARGVRDPRVLEAMRTVPRHRFVDPSLAGEAYNDYPLPIGHGQTISQPFIVAYMVELLRVKPEHRVLEVGTGCGYQAAVLGELAREVYTIEIVEPLARCAK